MPARARRSLSAALTCAADDGVTVEASVTGAGPPLVLLAGGIDYLGRGWDSTIAHLAEQRRVVRYVRRFYRPELGDPFALAMRDEARDVAALATALGGRVDLLAHSSGGVLALESLISDPQLYRSAVVFEAPIVLDSPLGGAALTRARDHLAAGHEARAMKTFFTEVVGSPAWSAWLAAVGLTLAPGYRRRIPGQLADLAAIDALGDRRGAYAAIAQPVLGVYGTASPPHLGERMRALLRVLPKGEPWQVTGDHSAQSRDPEAFARRVLEFLPAD